MSLLFEQHRAYLSDLPRLEAFRAAINRVVRPGDVVVDIGAGTGVLALLACEAGASRVYAIERDPILVLGRKIAQTNGCGERIRWVHNDSSRADLPEPVDVVVGDLIGHFAFEAGIFNVLADARARYLKPGGQTIPSAIALHIAPAECPELRSDLHFWRERPAGFDMSAAYDYARKTAHHVTLLPAQLLSDPVAAGDYALPLTDPPTITVDATTRASRDGVIDALAGWFDATLAPGVHMTNDPRAARRLNRRNLVLPVTDPIPVRAGDDVAVSLKVLPIEHVFRWKVRRRDAEGQGQSFSGSTFEGLLVSREDVAHLSAESRPQTTPDGRAVALVLDLADGRRSVQEIEDAVVARHPELFPIRARAAEFVADALLRYAR